MNKIDLYLKDLQEGKKWDKTKKFLDKHKGKFMAGAVALAVATRAAKAIKKNDPKNNNQKEPHWMKSDREKRERMRTAAASISHCPIVNGKRSATRKMGKVVCNT